MNKFKSKLLTEIKKIKPLNIVFALLGGILLGFVIRNIHEISPITEGGMLGLTLLIDHWLHISSSITTPILNLICYLIAYKVMGKGFIFYSIFAVAGYSGSLAIFELFPPLYQGFADNLWLSSIVGGIGVGVSCGICLLANSGPTADDALAVSVVKLTKLNIAVVYMISDLIVLALSLTYIPWQLILYSLLTVFVSGQILGLMQYIIDYRKKKKQISQKKTTDESEVQTETEENTTNL